jgi:glycogen debranching enzyme
MQKTKHRKICSFKTSAFTPTVAPTFAKVLFLDCLRPHVKMAFAAVVRGAIALCMVTVACTPQQKNGGRSPNTTTTKAAPVERKIDAKSRPDHKAPETLRFRIKEGDIENLFFRKGPLAVHLLASSGKAPRLLAAFPAGNTGIGIWFEPTAGRVNLKLAGSPQKLQPSPKMHGVRIRVTADTPKLVTHRVLLSSIRVLRMFQVAQKTLPQVSVQPRRQQPRRQQPRRQPRKEKQREPLQGEKHQRKKVRDPKGFQKPARASAVVWSRQSVDGKHRYTLRIRPVSNVAIRVAQDGRVTLTRLKAKPMRFDWIALCDETPLTPIPIDALLNARAAPDPKARNVLAFLSYKEKLLAGSWRFLTYFGRDTMLTLELLFPVLQSAVIEAGLGAILKRIGPDGQVAHEEDVGEWVALRPGGQKAPRFDYDNLDDDLMLAPLAARYLLDHPQGKARARAFLNRPAIHHPSFRTALARNLKRVLAYGAPYEADPSVQNLLKLKKGHYDGQWRDSRTGLAGGRIPYDINAVLLPTALEAAARLWSSGLLSRNVARSSPPQPPRPARLSKNAAAANRAARAQRFASVWSKVKKHFRVTLGVKQARRRIRAFARKLGVPFHAPTPPSSSHRAKRKLTFYALALDSRGRPLPIMHSDTGYALYYRRPKPQTLTRLVSRVREPFPAGLRTPVGLLVAHPGFAANPALHRQLTRHHYHGLVVWSWQNALWAEGLRRQHNRKDLSPALKNRLRQVQKLLWKAIRRARRIQTSELWTWRYEKSSGYRIVPFGQSAGHETESNAAQLWSTVFLAVSPPNR